MAVAASAAVAAGVTEMAERDLRIGAALAAATCSLLGTAAPGVSIAADAEAKWDIDSAFLYYGESDGRVKDLSLSAYATRFRSTPASSTRALPSMAAGRSRSRGCTR